MNVNGRKYASLLAVDSIKALESFQAKTFKHHSMQAISNYLVRTNFSFVHKRSPLGLQGLCKHFIDYLYINFRMVNCM